MSAGQDTPNPSNLAFVEELYADFLRDPQSVLPEWRSYFSQISNGHATALKAVRGPTFKPSSIFDPPAAQRNGGLPAAPTIESGDAAEMARLQHRVDLIIRNYRIRGHMIAAIDPLGRPRPMVPELDPQYYGFSEADLDRPFSTDMIAGPNVRTLREILAILFNTYCQSIGAQFMHIDDLNMRQWLQDRMESTENRMTLSRQEQLRILMKLTDAVIFEDFLRLRYQGKKTFSLEGGESLIPLLDLSIEKGASQGVREIVLAMAHRGRLNVLANIMGKSPQKIFREFEDKAVDAEAKIGRGDVKYHLGYSSDWKAANGTNVHLSLCFNPSHLEFVNSVALGRVRAKQDRYCNDTREQGMCLLIHGDAAFIGEGVTQETLNLSRLPGYATGGTLHVIVNNQIGFTTGPEEGRSSSYASTIARMLHIPIFHVNGEDPEAVAQVVNLAMDFRQKFKRDVVIDMYCYRRRGHNEQDEPAFTQPLMYKAIEARKNVREGYLEHLLKLGGVTRDEADKLATLRREHLERDLSAARSDDAKLQPETQAGIWANFVGGLEADVVDIDTGVPVERLGDLLELQTRIPAGFHPHPTIVRSVIEPRSEMARGQKRLDWGAAEALAFASLATEGHRIRLSGQDCGRGTFSHRHAHLHDFENGARYIPLQHLSADQAAVEIVNSPLSEIAVMGFEYGYSLDLPEGLVLWEAQFGDFANVAQVVIDQFIASAEEKWHRLSGLVLLLPHGFEGQGPEHSSARIERFLELAAGDNMQVIYPTTPAQYFHALRRQVKRKWRKPLVVMTPKKLLRLAAATSTLEDCATGRFRRVLPDSEPARKDVDRILLCSGKVYYDLLERREKTERNNVAIIRLEQYYPIPDAELRAAFSPYPEGVPVIWVQEEPENQGAWRFLYANWGASLFGHPLSQVSRAAAASPATGSEKAHHIEQTELIDEAFGAVVQRRTRRRHAPTPELRS